MAFLALLKDDGLAALAAIVFFAVGKTRLILAIL